MTSIFSDFFDSLEAPSNEGAFLLVQQKILAKVPKLGYNGKILAKREGAPWV